MTPKDDSIDSNISPYKENEPIESSPPPYQNSAASESLDEVLFNDQSKTNNFHFFFLFLIFILKIYI